MNYLVCIFFLFSVSSACGQAANIQSFIPKDYDTLYGGLVKGDLNKDGVDDAVLALYHKMEEQDAEKIDTDSIPPRLLIILFGTAKGYVQSATSSAVLLCKHCGGVFGDPFSGITIEKNVLTISHYGGSSWRWSIDDKFRFQNNEWYLIGETKYSYWDVEHCDTLDEFAGTDYEDINFVTGQYEIKKISEDCKLLENKKGKKPVQPLKSLTQFSIEN